MPYGGTSSTVALKRLQQQSHSGCMTLVACILQSPPAQLQKQNLKSDQAYTVAVNSNSLLIMSSQQTACDCRMANNASSVQ
jgi:hypothetical protein